MLPRKEYGVVLAVLMAMVALTALALHSSVKGARPVPNVSRPISYLTATSAFNIATIDESGSSSVTLHERRFASFQPFPKECRSSWRSCNP